MLIDSLLCFKQACRLRRRPTLVVRWSRRPQLVPLNLSGISLVRSEGRERARKRARESIEGEKKNAEQVSYFLSFYKAQGTKEKRVTQSIMSTPIRMMTRTKNARRKKKKTTTRGEERENSQQRDVPLLWSILFIRSGQSGRLDGVGNMTEIVMMMDLHSHWTSRKRKEEKKKDQDEERRDSLPLIQLIKTTRGKSACDCVNCAHQANMNMSFSYTRVSQE